MEENYKKDFEELTLIIKGGFDEVGDRFNKVDERLDKIEDDVEKLKKGQERIEMRLMNVVYRSEFEKLKEKVDFLIKKAEAA